MDLLEIEKELKEITKQQRQKKKLQCEEFDANSILDGKISVRQAFLRMHTSLSSNPKTAVKQYVQYIAKLLKAYKDGSDTKEVFRHFVYAAQEAKKNAICLNEEHSRKTRIKGIEDTANEMDKPYIASYDELSQMTELELRSNFIKNMENLLTGINNAFIIKDTYNIVAYGLAISEFTELTAYFLNQ